MATWRDVIEGDSRWSCEAADCRSWLASLPADSVHCWVTSPPYYGLRSYMPNGVRLRPDLTPEQVAYVMAELDRAGVKPTSHTAE